VSAKFHAWVRRGQSNACMRPCAVTTMQINLPLKPLLLTSAGQGWLSVSVAKDGEKGPCSQPRIWGRLHGVCYSAFVKTSPSVTLRPGLGMVT
jgi:hypothetical protein